MGSSMFKEVRERKREIRTKGARESCVYKSRGFSLAWGDANAVVLTGERQWDKKL